MSDLQRVAELITKVQVALRAWDGACAVRVDAEAAMGAARTNQEAARLVLERSREELAKEVGL